MDKKLRDEYRKKKRFKTISAVLVLVMKGDKVLLQKRGATGFGDGLWDFSASGHVEEGETMREAVFREANEEIGIEVKGVKFLGLIHSLGEDKLPRYLGIFRVTDYRGTPQICEPDKCSELRWFKLNELPKEDILASRRMALEALDDPGFYLEYGWN